MSKIGRLSKQKSVMNIEANPLESGAVSNITTMRLENLSDCVLISPQQLADLIKRLQAVEANEERLKIMEETKTPYLFTSENLLNICEVTTSVKTRIHMIGHIGPRLTDPKARTEQFLGMFRFSEEKNQVEEILKARAQAIQSAVFSTGGAPSTGGGRGLGGRGMIGGRGAGRGRGAGTSTSHTAANNSTAAKNSTANIAATPPKHKTSSSEPFSNRLSVSIDTSKQSLPDVSAASAVATTPNTADIKSNVSTPLNTPENRISGMDDVFDFLDANGGLNKSARSSRRVIMQTISEDNNDDGSSDEDNGDDKRKPLNKNNQEEEEEEDVITSFDAEPETELATGITSAEDSSPFPTPATASKTIIGVAEVKDEKEDIPCVAKTLFSPAKAEEEQEPPVAVPTTEEIQPETSEENSSNNRHESHNYNRDSIQTVSSDKTPINIGPGGIFSSTGKDATTTRVVLTKEKTEKRLDSFYDIDTPVDDDDDDDDNDQVDVLSAITEEPSVRTENTKLLTVDTLQGEGEGALQLNKAPLSTTSSLTSAPVSNRSTRRTSSRATTAFLPHAAASFTNGSTSSNAYQAQQALPSTSTQQQQQQPQPQPQPSGQVSFLREGTGEVKRVGRRHSEFSMITAQQQSLKLNLAPSAGGVDNDLAAKYAHLLSMSKIEFLALERAEPVRVVEEMPQFTYEELLRIVYRKDYGDLKQNQLELYLCDEEFEKVFVGKNKGQFTAQAKWRQVEQKKKAHLF